MTNRSEKLSGLLRESRLIVETGRLVRDFEPLRRAIRIAVGRNFGLMLVTLGFTMEGEPGAALAVKCKGFGKMSAQEFRETAEPAIYSIFRKKAEVRVGKNFVEWTFVFDLRE